MNIILSSGKVGHYYNMALVLQRSGHLKRFITTSFFRHLNQNSVLNKLIIHVSKSKILGRTHSELQSSLVKPIFFPEILFRLLKYIPFISNGIAMKIYNSCFDFASCRYIDKADIFLVAVSYGLFSSQKARKNGAIIVLDMINAHPRFCIDTLKEEAKLLNITIKVSDEYYLKRMEKEFQIADFILVPSEFVYKTLINEGIQAHKIRVIPYGVNIDRFSVKQKKDTVFRIIFVGTLTIRKGVHYLLKAYEELNLKNSELLLVGKPANDIKPFLKKYEGHFKHIPVVPHKFINDYYTNSSIFILPSLVEGSALVVYEAMACGLPVIVTENCGSIVRDKKEGFIIPIRDTESLKEKILLLYNNEQIRQEMGKAAREQVERYSWRRYQEDLINNLNDFMKLRKLS